MSKRRAQRAGARATSHRKHRCRPMPKWLKDPSQLDAVARSRCMLVLSVLSGERPVSDAIAQARISRGTYYQLETRALQAMLSALNPLATARRRAPPDLSATRIEALLERIRQLEQDKRRAQRLLLMSRKALQPPPKMLAERRARMKVRARLGLTPIGRTRSDDSKARPSPASTSTATRAGESAC
jgi:hypothetical protein